MKWKSIALSTMFLWIIACGTERPNPDDYRSQGPTAKASGDQTKKPDSKTADMTKTPETTTPTVDPNKPTTDVNKPATPAAPAAPKAAKRVAPNTAEIDAAKALWTASCQSCHGTLAATNKRNSTAAAITGAPTKFVMPHAGVKDKIPKDVEDPSDDGVDQAMLNLKALEAALKI